MRSLAGFLFVAAVASCADGTTKSRQTISTTDSRVDRAKKIAASIDGATCTQPSDCNSGFCVDGVCCDTACTGTCQSCLAAMNGSVLGDGTCGNITATANVTCQAAATCTDAATCSGLSPTCPTPGNKADGTSCGAGEICGSGTCEPACFVGGVVFAAGAANPANNCQACSPSTSTTAFTADAAGTSCGIGLVCDGKGDCLADCFIGGTLYAANAMNPANACQTCQPLASTTSFTNVADGTMCGTGADGGASGDTCSSGTCSATCTVNGVTYASGAVNPLNACQVCNPSVSATSFSNEPVGMSCGAGEVCDGTGTCAADCYINGTIYTGGTVDPANACQVCAPLTSTKAWSNEPDGTSCGTGMECTSGTCTATCTINGMTYAAGTTNPTNACQICNPASSPTAWTSEPAGTSCAGGAQVCDGAGGCQNDCFIGGKLYANGTVNPANPCQVCTTTTSTTSWSNEPTGTACGTGMICGSAGMCVADCTIGGVTYPAGAVNPTNGCQVCNPATSTTAFSNEPAGTVCGVANTNVCDGTGACQNDCFIGGMLYAAGTANPSNACQVCTPVNSTSAWSNEPNGTTCGASSTCTNGSCAATCSIGGVTYANGAPNPANNCQACISATSTTAFSNDPDGTSCGAGEVCNAGACTADCYVGGTFYAPGKTNPANPCQVCAPLTSTTAFSNEPDGTSCGTGMTCASGACAADCVINGVTYPAGAPSPTNPCAACVPASSTTAFTNQPAGTACGLGEVCDGSGACAMDCSIGGMLYGNGKVNPANACQVCNSLLSTSAWTNEPNGTTCGAGMECSGGACLGDCTVSGVTYPAGTANPANGCQACVPATSTSSFSNLPTGTSCGVGEVCSATGTCVADCFINGMLYATGTVNPSNACQVCAAAVSTTTWSNEPNGTACGSAGQSCSSGACASACVVGGVTYPAGAPNPTNACQVCNSASSTTAFSSQPDGTSCAVGEVCASGACTAGCFINSTLYPAGTVNPANPCQVCAPALSTTAWSSEPNGTSCGGGQTCSSGQCGSCVINGVSYPAGTGNPTNMCQMCVPSKSTSSWSNDPDGSQCGLGEVCNAGACKIDCYINGTFYAAGAVNPANPCQVCTPVLSVSTWSSEPNGMDCGGGNVCLNGACGTCDIGGVTYPGGAIDPTNPCEVCNPAASTTEWSNAADGSLCPLGTCSAGVCTIATTTSSSSGATTSTGSSTSSSSGMGGATASSSSSGTTSTSSGMGGASTSSTSSTGTSTSSTSSTSSSSGGGAGGAASTSSGNTSSSSGLTDGGTADGGTDILAEGGGCRCDLARASDTRPSFACAAFIAALVLRRRRSNAKPARTV